MTFFPVHSKEVKQFYKKHFISNFKDALKQKNVEQKI
jgi:hypothetical protein